jgi:ubiquinone/menaquinone biosynthesis C-methylase UbiE
MTQYNLVADQYDLSFQLAPYRLHVEAYSLYTLLGDITGKRILDLATGTGFYARALSKQGAGKVVAVDIADEMVKIGQMAEEAEPLGVEYYTGDVMSFISDTPFDLGLAVYLLHYAPTKEALGAMCMAIARNIVSGGRFVTYVLNPDMSHQAGYYGEYGLNITMSQEMIDGQSAPFTVSLGGMTTPEIMAYRWNQATIEQALTDAGFTNITWVMPTLSPEGEAQYGKAYFETYIQQPHAILIDCIKA